MNGNKSEINKCTSVKCPFNKKNPISYKSSLRKIKSYCFDCSDNNFSSVRNCDFATCLLYPYRQGKNPSRKGVGGNPKPRNTNSG